MPNKIIQNIISRHFSINSGCALTLRGFGVVVLAFIILFSSESLQAQKKKKKKIHPQVAETESAIGDTIHAIVARNQWQFPIKKFFDDAMKAAQKSQRPVMAFNVDYVEPTSIHVRDSLLRDADVMVFLTKNFELALHDYSVDPPPEVGFDSLRTLGSRLDKLEKGYDIVSRPTAIIIRPDGSEIERIPNLQNYSGDQFIKTVRDYLDGKNTIESLAKDFWSDPKNLDKHKRYLDRMMERFDYDSILYHYDLLARHPGFGQTPQVMKEAAAEYAYLRFKQEGNVAYLKGWLASLDRRTDSAVIIAGYRDLVEYYQTRKKIDSIATYYNAIFTFTGDRDPDLLNNFAWDLTTFSTKYDSALALSNEAIARDGKNPNYYDTRALVEYYLKDYDGSIADSKLALKYSSKEDKEYFKERAEYYEKEKKRAATEDSKD
ncbi:MAG: hypothetical protein Q8919_13980 [Bacteroidota bacterium]|nr:hypothetical protein [Bacteroidota bacterium]